MVILKYILVYMNKCMYNTYFLFEHCLTRKFTKAGHNNFTIVDKALGKFEFRTNYISPN